MPERVNCLMPQPICSWPWQKCSVSTVLKCPVVKPHAGFWVFGIQKPRFLPHERGFESWEFNVVMTTKAPPTIQQWTAPPRYERYLWDVLKNNDGNKMKILPTPIGTSKVRICLIRKKPLKNEKIGIRQTGNTVETPLILICAVYAYYVQFR